MDSRRDHLLGRWGGMVGMLLILLGLTCFFQKRKDRAWTKPQPDSRTTSNPQ